MIKRVLSIFAILAAATMRTPGELVVHLPFDLDGTAANNTILQARPNSGAKVEPANARLGEGAAWFDGKSGIFHLPITPAVSNETRSVSLWIWGTNSSLSSPSALFMGWGSHKDEIGIRFDFGLEYNDDSRLRLEFNSGNFVVSRNRSGGSVIDGKWHHLAAVYDGDRIVFYVDGREYGPPVKPPYPLKTVAGFGTSIGAGVREATSDFWKRRFFGGRIDDVGIWNSPLSYEEVRLIHGLACIGDNDLRWLEPAHKLWQQPVGSTARINGQTWRRVQGLNGKNGEWVRVLEANGAGSFIVLDGHGGGLQITPYWWEQPWSQAVGIGFVVMGAAALLVWLASRVHWRVQMRRLEAKERAEAERRRIAQDLHDDLGSRLTEIMMVGDLAKKEQMSREDLGRQLAAITVKTRELVVALDEMVWTANPVNDVLLRLADYLASYTQRFLSAKGIACRIDIMEGLSEAPINAKVRHHLLMSVKEALNNAVKYSGATEVWLRIHCVQDELRVVVEDNGCGFDLQSVRKGNGLANLRSRLEEAGGQTEIKTLPGKGTCVTFTLSLRKLAG